MSCILHYMFSTFYLAIISLFCLFEQYLPNYFTSFFFTFRKDERNISSIYTIQYSQLTLCWNIVTAIQTFYLMYDVNTKINVRFSCPNVQCSLECCSCISNKIFSSTEFKKKRKIVYNFHHRRTLDCWKFIMQQITIIYIFILTSALQSS